MSGRGRWLIVAGAVVVIALAAVILRRPAAPTQSGVSGRTVTVGYGSVQPQVGGTGSIRTSAAVTLVAEAVGTLQTLPVKVGEQVAAGQTIASIDDQGASAARVAQARAALTAAQTQLQQMQNPSAFVSSDAVSQAQAGVQQAQAALAQAQAAEAQAQTAYNTAVSAETLTAPIDGYVVDLAVNPGQAVAPGTPVVTIAPDLQNMQVEAQVLQENLYNVYVGEEAAMYIPGTDSTYGGTVAKIAGQPDQTTAQGTFFDVTVTIGAVTSSNPSSTKLAAGMSAYVNLFSNKPGQLPNTPGLIQTQPIPNSSTVVAQGTVSYADAWVVTTAAAGNVATLPLGQGAYVLKGETVATLTGAALTDAVQQAQAALATAKTGVGSAEAALTAAQTRAQETASPSAAAPAQIAAQQSAVQEARAALQAAQQAAAQLAVKAPFPGVISATMVSAGQQVAPGTAVATLVDPTTMQAVVQVPAAEIGLVATGQTASVAVAAEGRTYSGTVSQISPQGQNIGGTTVYSVVINIAQPQGLQAGQSVTAGIRVPPMQHALVIPAAAVSGGAVMVAGANGAHAQAVTLGPSDGTNVVVLQGLRAGQQIIVPSTAP
jgi:RND family efflux transporter MFP subunit